MNGWQRIGVVVSVLWVLSILGVAFYQYESEPRYETKFILPQTATRNPDGSLIFGGLLTRPPVSWDYKYEAVAVWMLAPTIIFWILSYTILFCFRWVRDGFTKE